MQAILSNSFKMSCLRQDTEKSWFAKKLFAEFFGPATQKTKFR
ncbi:hypothetical protein STRDD11_00724 [Streptococcus sp. DD11]|nr:hypothetical protein STRDD11_00724 [Streptococcus sp. DD11]